MSLFMAWVSVRWALRLQSKAFIKDKDLIPSPREKKKKDKSIDNIIVAIDQHLSRLKI
jgi:hypothetical protein